MASSATAGLLGRQLKQMQTDKDIPGISCGLADNNIFEWEVMLMISDDCKFYGGRPPRSQVERPVEGPLSFLEEYCKTQKADQSFKHQVDSFVHGYRFLQNIHIYHQR